MNTVMVRVKICGITSPKDAAAAASAGADAIGVVFYPPSPRYVGVDIGLVREIAQAAGPFVSVVGLFVNETSKSVMLIAQEASLNMLQLHGDETPEFCEQLELPYIKALRMKPGVDIAAQAGSYTNARGILLDAYKKGVPGGTGETFDWAAIPLIQHPLILAGGLNPDNIRHAIEVVQPHAVDVSGGVEASPGIKDPKLVSLFVSHAKNVMAQNAY